MRMLGAGRLQPVALLAVALGLFLWLAGSIDSVGPVGEVEATWALPDPPEVIVSVGPTVFATGEGGHLLGTPVLGLEAAQVRPVESLRLGNRRLPLAVNTYTGGLPDWPSRGLFATVPRVEVVGLLHALYGVLLIVLVWRVAGSGGAAGAAALWLASDWNFVFYRRVLGGTEVWLIGASLLLLRGIWDRRWGGGGIAPWAIALAVGAGLHAKITFVAVLFAAAAATALTRWDRGNSGVPNRISREQALGAAALLGLLTAPLLWTWVHHGLLAPSEPHLRSHDFLGLQWERLWSGLGRWLEGASGPARERPSNIVDFLLRPVHFLGAAWGADSTGQFSVGRLVGWILTLLGTVLVWREHTDRRPSAALHRWLSLAIPLAVIALVLLNRDIHHLAMLTGWMALWAGLSVARIAALITPPRSLRGSILSVALLLPWVVSGVLAVRRTDAVVETTAAPMFSERGQREVAEVLRANHVRRVLTTDYDVYGALDMRLTDVEIVHGWGALSRPGDRVAVLEELLLEVQGGHYLALRPAAPTIYSLQPGAPTLRRLNRVQLTLIDHRADARGTWLSLYSVAASNGEGDQKTR